MRWWEDVSEVTDLAKAAYAAWRVKKIADIEYIKLYNSGETTKDLLCHWYGRPEDNPEPVPPVPVKWEKLGFGEQSAVEFAVEAVVERIIAKPPGRFMELLRKKLPPGEFRKLVTLLMEERAL
jgi:hypothetical protein